MSNKKKSKEKVSLLGYDPVETPEEIISKDKDENRKEAFKDAYKVIMKVIPEFFLTNKKKKNTSSSGTGGNTFTQNIIVTTENVKIETNNEINQEYKDEKERE